MFKKLLVIAAIILIAQNWRVVHGYFNPPPEFVAQTAGEVVLYATSWCGYCAKARKLMGENNIDYLEYDIEKSSEGREQYEALGGGGVPVLLIDGQVVRGFNPDKILKLAKGI